MKCLHESCSVFSAERVFDVQHCTQMLLSFQKDKRAGQSMSQGKKTCFLSLSFPGTGQRLEAAELLFDTLW